MRWRNTETPTFTGSDGTQLTGPDIVEVFEALDHNDSAVAAITKDVTGATSMTVGGVAVPTDSSTSTLTNKTLTAPAGTGFIITKIVPFIENATNTIHTGTVTLPAGSWLHEVAITSSVLWGATSASMDVGDTADPNGYFDTINLKATDLLVGEVLSTAHSTLWGGQEGAYLVAASGRRGPATTNFGMYYEAGSDIVGVITVGTPAVTTGRTFMTVTYSVPTPVAAVATGP